MIDESEKQSGSLAQRFPEQTQADAVQAVLRAGIAAIPLIGGTITELISLVLAPAVERRKEEWFKDLAEGLFTLQEKVEGFRLEDLQHNEQFVSAVIQATRSAVSTHKSEKREALKNALLNIALHRAPDEDQQAIFLRYIDELTVWHTRILWLLQDPPRQLSTMSRGQNTYGMGAPAQLIENVFPELSGRRDIYDQVATDLRNRGLINSPADFLHTMMTGSGMVAKRTTPLADAFLAFIADPLR